MGSPQTNPCLDSSLAYLREPFAEMVALAKEGNTKPTVPSYRAT